MLNQNSEKKVKISGKPMPMKGSTEIEFITNRDLAKRITSFMKQIFVDYKGTNVYRDEFNNILVDLYFSKSVANCDQDSAKTTALVKVEDKSEQAGGKWARDFNLLNNTMKGVNRPFELSDDAKSILKLFFDGDVNWNQVVAYRDDYALANTFSMNRSSEVILTLNYANINKIVKAMHGATKEVDWDDQPHRLSYMVKFNRAKIDQQQMMMQQMMQFGNQIPMDQMMQNMTMPQYDMFGNIIPKSFKEEEIILELICFDEVAYQEVSNLIGVAPTPDKGIVMF